MSIAKCKINNQIEEGNIDFFINKNYQKDIGNIADSEYILNKINILRDPVRNMDKNEQEKVIKYMQNLSKLCNIYHN